MERTQRNDMFSEILSNVLFSEFANRELKEIIFEMVCGNDFVYGANEHNRLILIAKFYRKLREVAGG